MIDIHTHCLPFVDDGADSLETGLEMLKSAKLNGAHTVAATPHFYTGKIDVDSFLSKRNDALSLVTESILNREYDYPRIVTGAEVYINSDISEMENIKKLCYDNTDYMLLEIANGVETSSLSEWIYNLTIIGVKPIIAHIDRYAEYKKIMQELCGIDVVYQLNASEFCGFWSFGDVKDIMKRHNKFVVSSDMHNLEKRPFNMHKAFDKAKKHFASAADIMFEEGAKKILENKPFEF